MKNARNIPLSYSPFGAELTGRSFNSKSARYGYQGSEKENELSSNGDGNNYTTQFRELDPRLGRWMAIDPKPNAFESPYISMGNNPILANDIKGDVVDGDKKGMENYNKYKGEINGRIAKIKDAMKGVDANSKEYSKLNDQLNSYENINKELTSLEQDKKNLYFINSDVQFNDDKEGGKTYYKEVVKVGDKEMKQINIDLAPTKFPLNPTAHELKHAFQYFEGRLIMSSGKEAFDSQELEKEAFERGNRFNGNTLYNNNSFNMNYIFNSKNFELPDVYKDYPPFAEPYSGNEKAYEKYSKTNKVQIIFNTP